MARPKRPEGTIGSTVVKTRSGLLQGVLIYPDGSKKRMDEPFPKGTSKARAKDRAAAVADGLNEAGAVMSPKAAAALTAEPNRKPMEAWLKVWNTERIEIQELTSTSDNMTHYREHIGPLTNWTHVRDWEQDVLRKVSRGLSEKIRDGKMSGKTAVNVWSTVTQICSDATEHDDDAIRCRDYDPSERVRGPKRGLRKEKQALRPHEALKFVGCTKVPLLWRAVLAVAVYTYLRDGELRVLLCRDVQLENEIISVTKAWIRARPGRPGHIGPPKGKRPREVPIEPTLRPLLVALTAGRPGDALLFPNFPSERDMSRGLKRWLRNAGVDRHELLHKTPTTIAMTFHDARSTGILWRAVRNDPKFEIQVQAGHRRFSTTESYMDLANRLRRGFGDVFPELPAELVEQAPSLPSAGVLDHVLDHAAE